MPSRRQMVLSAAVAGLSLAGGGPLAAAQRVLTPRQTAGPFYPLELPLDSDNDLVQVQGRSTPAKGVVTHIFGRVITAEDKPVSGARVEIWQCDAEGRYHHPADRGGRADPNFQGFGAVETGAEAAYRFRTIRPMPYPGRTPHIHFAIRAPGMETLTTQMYVKGEPGNARDGLFNRIRDPEARASVLVELRPAPEIEAAALAGTFDIVVAHPDAS